MFKDSKDDLFCFAVIAFMVFFGLFGFFQVTAASDAAADKRTAADVQPAPGTSDTESAAAAAAAAALTNSDVGMFTAKLADENSIVGGGDVQAVSAGNSAETSIIVKDMSAAAALTNQPRSVRLAPAASNSSVTPAAAECKTMTNLDKKYDATFAVASNLWLPMTKEGGLVSTYYDLVTTDFEITVCHDSTGNFVKEITTGGNPLHYTLFLAANDSAPGEVCDYDAALCLTPGGSLPLNPYDYARGKAILYALDNINNSKWDNTTGIINVGPGATQHLHMGNSTLAPYGLAGEQILNSTNQTANVAPIEIIWSNIDQVYQAILGDNTSAGIIGASQPCVDGNITGGQYFEYNLSLYGPIIQSGLVLNSTDQNAVDAAVSFSNFLLSNAAGMGQDVLASNCYLSPVISALSKLNSQHQITSDSPDMLSISLPPTVIGNSPLFGANSNAWTVIANNNLTITSESLGSSVFNPGGISTSIADNFAGKSSLSAQNRITINDQVLQSLDGGNTNPPITITDIPKK